MNRNQPQANRNKFTGKARQTWGKFTDDELEQIAGKRDVLVGQIQKKYGIGQAAAEQQVSDFEAALNNEKSRS